MTSLRTQLSFFWLLLTTVCVGLGLVMLLLFRHGAGSQIDALQAQTEQACTQIAARYDKSLADPSSETPQLDLLQVLLQLVLVEVQSVEGGVWRESGGFLSYAYPTYEGGGVKTDVPQAEQAHIAAIARVAARTQQPQTDVTRGLREALVLSACPLRSPHGDLVGWTMARASLATLDAQTSLRVGLGALLAFALASGLWLGRILARGYRHVQRLEAQLAEADGDGPSQPFAATGVKELDRIVAALNGHRQRLHAAREQLDAAALQHARDQRLAVLGRMTGGIAHEIRNPIAAMRLKAENALAGPAERQPAALQLILEQIARLDGLVQSLLAVVQPIQLQLRAVDLAAWLGEHVASFERRAAARQLRLGVEAEALTMSIDPTHLGRAVDNLIDNALRHAAGRVDVSLRRTPRGGLRIQVDDDGAGVAESLRDQLFEPFASGRPDGTGLGLAMAREVALAHGGELSHVSRSQTPRGITRFEIELPWRDS